MYKNKSSLAKCAKNEAALARPPEETGLFLLISELHIWRLGTLLKRCCAFSSLDGGVRPAEVPLLGVGDSLKCPQQPRMNGGFTIP